MGIGMHSTRSLRCRLRWLPLAIFVTVAGPHGELLGDDVEKAGEIEFFETKIRPVLVEHCYECHAADSKIIRGGLRLDSREGMRQGGDSGPAVVPGDLEGSLILDALRHETFEMPPDNPLPATVIDDFVRWIEGGAEAPEDAASPLPDSADEDRGREHWAFQPIAAPAVPEVSDVAWVRTPVDSFILSRLEQAGLRPSPEADKRTLIRRATFDLIGLPPTPEEVAAFVADDSPDSFARVVDRLLDSPHYGERWGRHWLDLVRYADTNGADENHAMPEAWRYREWVIRMLNQDLPLDQFLVRQLAGDLLPVPEDEREAGDLLTATGMLVIGPKMLAEQDKDKMIIDIVDEQVDTVGRTMLGLTIGCARCHDHKFDPITAEDYYGLAGIFYSTQSMANREFVSKWMERPLPSAEIDARRAEHQQKIDKAREEHEGDDAAKAIEQLEKEMPQYTMVMAVAEGEPTDLPVHIRGNHLALADQPTPRGVPEVFHEVVPPPEIPAEASGRMELARWIVAPENPLTTRVLVNRIWLWHFGEGLVRSPSNFGLRGETPTHPKLLDWLAGELVRRRWSLKDMHRLIMLSSTYRMSSDADAERESHDLENRLWWRQNRRRLEAEPIRDAILAVGGALDATVGGHAPDTSAPRRAVYLPVNRSALYTMFSTFDYVEPDNHIAQRPTTTVPHQALFLLNSPMVDEQSRRLAEVLLAAGDDEAQRVTMAFERLYGRQPTQAEITAAARFLQLAPQMLPPPQAVGSQEPTQQPLETWAALCRTLIAANEFIYID